MITQLIWFYMDIDLQCLRKRPLNSPTHSLIRSLACSLTHSHTQTLWMASSRVPSDFTPSLGHNDHFNVFVQILMNVTVIPVKIRAPAQTRSTVTAAPVQMDMKAQIVRQVGSIHSGVNKMTKILHTFSSSAWQLLEKCRPYIVIYVSILKYTNAWHVTNDQNAVTLETEKCNLINYVTYVSS